jgi:hypothetical protein
MRFKIDTTSSQTKVPCTGCTFENGCWYIEIATLEDLILLRNQLEQDLILLYSHTDKGKLELEIYNTYRE